MKDMKSLIIALSVAAAFALETTAVAQNVDPALLLNPPADSWPTYHGDYPAGITVACRASHRTT
jgi:hypothetical protein